MTARELVGFDNRGGIHTHSIEGIQEGVESIDSSKFFNTVNLIIGLVESYSLGIDK